jgi:hypothetical protein
MELKTYDKAYLLAFKGAFLFFFGIIAILQIVGSIKILNILFVILISSIGALLIGSGILLKKNKTKVWSVVSGIINLSFGIYLLLKMESPRMEHLGIILLWVLFFVLSEMVETGLLLYQKNAFAALLLINTMLSILFGYFLYVVMDNFMAAGVYYLGMIAVVFGLTNILSSYLLSRL